jgi:hypothetical protein
VLSSPGLPWKKPQPVSIHEYKMNTMGVQFRLWMDTSEQVVGKGRRDYPPGSRNNKMI